MDIRKYRGQLDWHLEPSMMGGLLPLDQRLDYVRREKPKLDVEPVVLDLEFERNNEVLNVQGDSLLVASISGALSVRFNEPNNPLHDLQVERNFIFGNESGFYRMFLTNSVEVGKSATLVIGRSDGLRVLQGIQATKLIDSDGDDIDPFTNNVLSEMWTGYCDVGTTQTTVMGAIESRKYMCIVNDSDEVIYLGFGASAVLNRGIRLNPHGGSYEITPLNLYTGTIKAIHGGTGTKRLVFIHYPAGD